MNNYEYETLLHQKGYKLIAGVDEVGRGPLAGPVVATAIIMPIDCYIEGVNDSKQVSSKKRMMLKKIIEEKAIAIATAFVDEKVIDEINIYEATKKAMLEALSKLNPQPDYILVDAMSLDTSIPSLSIIKGDEKSFTIACASIVAKETRDAYMTELDKKYPGYNFAQNKGYPTKAHKQALIDQGICEIHRKSYKPVANIINKK